MMSVGGRYFVMVWTNDIAVKRTASSRSPSYQAPWLSRAEVRRKERVRHATLVPYRSARFVKNK